MYFFTFKQTPDIIEEILGEEIVDETDAYIDGSHIVKVERQEEQGLDIAKFQLLNRNEGGAKLSHKEVGAIMAHLQLNYPKAVSILTDNQLERLIAETPISILPTATRELGRELPTDLLYEIGSPNDVCTLVLSGKVTVITGDDKIRTEVSPWTLLGISALQDPEYKADFTAFVSSGPCRCLRFTGQQNAHAVDVSASESLSLLKRSNSNSSDGSHYHGLHDGTTKQTNRREQRASELLAALQIAKQP